MKIRKLVCAMAALLTASAGFQTASAEKVEERAFPSYTYGLWGEASDCPAPYTLDGRVTGVDLGLPDFRQINDLFAAANGRVYVAVSGPEEEDNRIIVLDEQLSLLETAEGYTAADGAFVRFGEPLGIFVDADSDIYICDGKTKEVLHLDGQFREKLIIPAPTAEASAIINEEFTERYRPSKLAVDPTGRIHVVAININEGIVEFEPDGTFTGFLAAGKVKYSTIELLWRRLSTAAQRERMKDFVPVEYNNIELDEDGYLFATLAAMDENAVRGDIQSGSSSDQGMVVRRLNYLGSDIMDRNGYGPVVGDLDVLDSDLSGYTGISQITDVSCGENGTFTLLDNNRSHIFTYSQDGYLLYAFAGPDVTAGGLRMPVAVTQQEEYLYVADTGTRSVCVYRQTAFARSVQQALSAEYTGDLQEAEAAWEAVLEQSAEYALAYVGLGKIAYQSGEYETAMRLFEESQNSTWYSKAFKQYRAQQMQRYFVPAVVLLAATAVLAAVPLTWRYIRRRRRREQRERRESL
ncbi:MAG TPA: hypothetical protein H9684_02860 [Firmicutes bacterium]|nr:hypothetical protein [Bacillota bacterium]